MRRARALLKRPDFLIVNRALGALDANAQDAIVTRVLDHARGPDGPPRRLVAAPRGSTQQAAAEAEAAAAYP